MSIWHKSLTDDIWLVGVSGRIDQSQTPELEQELVALLDAGHSKLIVDLSEVTYMNSGGLRCLVSVWRLARKADGDVALCS